MAGKTTRKTTKTTQSTAKQTVAEAIKDVEEDVQETTKKIVEEKKTYKVKQNLDPNTVITVKNGFQGKLVYKSSKTGERFIWETFGDEQDMDLQELKSAKNSKKMFFENNWFLIDDPEVLEYLGVERYYKYALNMEGFSELFEKDPAEIPDIISKLSNGQKKTVVYKTKQMIANGEIDSLKVIEALERSLAVELIER